MKKLIGLILSTLFLGNLAYAGILIEPYLGYEVGGLKQTGTSNIDFKGVYYGARLGYRFLGLKIGADLLKGSEQAEQDGDKGDYNLTDIGAFVGYEFPAILQVYANYFVSSKAKIDPESTPEDFSGNGLRFGVGWTGLPYLSINLEAIYRTYTKYNNVALVDNLKASSYGVSISVPLP